eukprot:SAG31_NODE_2368_length_5854_cov_19.043440_12_plen_101_part_00
MGLDNTEFNLRHDWNSLLDAPSVLSMTASRQLELHQQVSQQLRSQVLPVTNRSTQRFPDAGVLATYLQDFGDLQVRSILIGTTHWRVSIHPTAQTCGAIS